MTREMEQFDDEVNPRIDPQLDSLLDEALSTRTIEGGVPADLAARVFATTKAMLPGAAERTQNLPLKLEAPARSGVIAWIGVRRFKLAAAIVLLACEAALVMVASSIAHEVRSTIVVKREFRQLARYKSPTDATDVELEMVSRQLDTAIAGRAWDGDSAAYDIRMDELGAQSVGMGSEVVF